MKLLIVPARTGIAWVRLGIRTFLSQPLALTGLFFIFMAVLSAAAWIPYLGSALSLVLLPAATLGLMAASREASLGRFPMPSVLISALRSGNPRMRSMLGLGALYAAGFLAVMGGSALFDGGAFARLYLVGGEVTRELVMQDGFQSAMWFSLALYVPLSMMFWHAPALVHWHGVQPVKAMFFSLVACWRSRGAYLFFALTWMGVFLGAVLLVTLVGAIIGGQQATGFLFMPTALLLFAMFFSSTYFTFRDSFEGTDISPSTPTMENTDA